jgi:stearoyl-CoA desaturase (delta-9 desaturase)
MSVPIVSQTPSESTASAAKAGQHWLRLESIVAAAVLGLPLLGSLEGLSMLFHQGISRLDLTMLVLLYTLTVAGIVVGYHRLVTHGSFQTGPVMRFILAVCGSMAAQGPILQWAVIHRRHHALSDRPGDPHSPRLHGGRLRGAFAGLWHAHIGWLFEMHSNLLGVYNLTQARTQDETNWDRFIPDLERDRVLMFVNRSYFLWLLFGLALPAAIGGWAAGLAGAWSGFMWGGLVRICFAHHVTGAINSLGHYFGTAPFVTKDGSTNMAWLAIPSFGDSWHNNHHAFPYSAWHGLRWYEIDLSGWLIRSLEVVGLAWNVKTVPAHRLPLPPGEAESAKPRSIGGPE